MVSKFLGELHDECKYFLQFCTNLQAQILDGTGPASWLEPGSGGISRRGIGELVMARQRLAGLAKIGPDRTEKGAGNGGEEQPNGARVLRSAG